MARFVRSGFLSMLTAAVMVMAFALPASAVSGTVAHPVDVRQSTVPYVPNGELTEEQVELLLLPAEPVPDVPSQMPAGDYSSLQNSPPPLVVAVQPPFNMPSVEMAMPPLYVTPPGASAVTHSPSVGSASVPGAAAVAAPLARVFPSASGAVRAAILSFVKAAGGVSAFSDARAGGVIGVVGTTVFIHGPRDSGGPLRPRAFLIGY